MKLFLNDFLKPISDTLYVMDEEISHPYYGRIMNLTKGNPLNNSQKKRPRLLF